MKVKVDFNSQAVEHKIKGRFSLAQKKLDAQVLKDSNYYIPKDTGSLEKSSIISSVIGSGLLVWNTPYAKAQYYGVNFNHSQSINKNARALWFEVAKSKNLERWRKLVDAEYHKNS